MGKLRKVHMISYKAIRKNKTLSQVIGTADAESVKEVKTAAVVEDKI